MKIVLPREHGAWGMLFAPLIIGAVASGLKPVHGWLFVAMLATYLTVNPFIQWLKNRKRNAPLLPWIIGYGLAALFSGFPLLFRFPALAWLIPPAGLMVLVNIAFALQKKERHLLNDLAAESGLSLGAVAAYYVGQETFSPFAWVLWAACLFLFFGCALHVKTLIREKGNRRIKRIANLYHLLLLLLPWIAFWAFPLAFSWPWLSLAYLFAALRAWLIPFNASLRPLTIGIIEIANTVWFVVAILIFLSL